ncbi:MAG: YggS family pyridoxal phosphate-dependent enzyme [Actinomycetota bacterium]|nr:YggS family pyridoxal phosphate-dependent enzyme [Actinomycetota bacterium]
MGEHGAGPPSVELPSVEVVRERLDVVRERIRAAGGDPATVEVLAVTKALPVDVVGLAAAVGLTSVGENYAQELVAKADEHEASGGAPVAWHMIGNVQRNKVRQLAGRVALWQTVDRASLVRELAKRDPGASVLIQVNTTGEEQKAGCAPGEVDALVDGARDAGLDVLGLMTVGPTDADAEAAPAFASLREAADRNGLAVRSMGMTADLETAVAEGSTMVRVGRALFGPRPPRQAVRN